MPANIEIKAKVTDLAKLTEIVAALSDAPGEMIVQEDIFFHANNGRLKLRIFSPHNGELIFYQRADDEAAKASHYIISHTDDPASLKAALSAALGIKGIVRKQRVLYLKGQTRIHLDRVEGLGDFLELEYVLKPEQDPQEGIKSSEELMQQLGIESSQLIAGAYLDLQEGR